MLFIFLGKKTALTHQKKQQKKTSSYPVFFTQLFFFATGCWAPAIFLFSIKKLKVLTNCLTLLFPNFDYFPAFQVQSKEFFFANLSKLPFCSRKLKLQRCRTILFCLRLKQQLLSGLLTNISPTLFFWLLYHTWHNIDASFCFLLRSAFRHLSLTPNFPSISTSSSFAVPPTLTAYFS